MSNHPDNNSPTNPKPPDDAQVFRRVLVAFVSLAVLLNKNVITQEQFVAYLKESIDD